MNRLFWCGSLNRIAIVFLAFSSFAAEPPVFKKIDSQTSGKWIGAYGSSGHLIVEGSVNLNYVGLSTQNAQSWVWNDGTADPAALQVPNARGGKPTCWYSPTQFSITVGFGDEIRHQLAFYCLDWDTTNRVQKVELIDYPTGATLHELTLSDFHSGKYLIYEVTGYVTFRFTRLAGHNAVVSGFFIDPPPTPNGEVATPFLGPPGREYDSTVQIFMSTTTPGASIFYTLDGSDPDQNDPLYTEPFILASSATVRARAFKEGMPPSAIAEATYTITLSGTAVVNFLGNDSSTLGNWRGAYGNSGFVVIKDWVNIPPFADITLARQSDHIWAYNIDDPSALQKFSSPSRLAACVYTPDFLYLRLRIDDTQPHKISLYFLDWDRQARTQRITITDQNNGAPLGTHDLHDFAQGTYLSWHVQGEVLFQIDRLTGPNAVLSGIFID